MDKKVVKLAIIRDDEGSPCPFGLDIPTGCKIAGETITRMAPLSILGDEAEDDEIKMLSDANRKLMLLDGSGGRCAYAGKLFKDKESVECNWDSNAPGVSENGLAGSPFYSKVYDNIAYDGLFSYPLGWYGDSNISRNLYYGAYSLQGSEKSNENKKIASLEQDIRDAAQHASFQEDSYHTGKVCYKIAFNGDMPLKEILKWDDYNNWGEWDPGYLASLDEESLKEELSNFRGESWANIAINWLNNGFPHIILTYTNRGPVIGDGRGRVSFAVGMNIDKLPVIIMNEDERGDICFNLENGLIK